MPNLTNQKNTWEEEFKDKFMIRVYDGRTALYSEQLKESVNSEEIRWFIIGLLLSQKEEYVRRLEGKKNITLPNEDIYSQWENGYFIGIKDAIEEINKEL